MRTRIVVLVCEQAISGLLETREGEVCGQMEAKDPQCDLAYRKLGLRTDASKREKVVLHCRRSMPWPGATHTPKRGSYQLFVMKIFLTG